MTTSIRPAQRSSGLIHTACEWYCVVPCNATFTDWDGNATLNTQGTDLTLKGTTQNARGVNVTRVLPVSTVDTETVAVLLFLKQPSEACRLYIKLAAVVE